MGFCLLLAAAGPEAMAACAAMAGLGADCRPPAQSHCEAAPSESPAPAAPEQEPLPSGGFPCCRILAAPRPQVVAQEAPLAASFDVASALSSDLVAPVATRNRAPEDVPDVSPPDRQPLLCVFLI
jgi:hypothetical protein